MSAWLIIFSMRSVSIRRNCSGPSSAPWACGLLKNGVDMAHLTLRLRSDIRRVRRIWQKQPTEHERMRAELSSRTLPRHRQGQASVEIHRLIVGEMLYRIPFLGSGVLQLSFQAGCP